MSLTHRQIIDVIDEEDFDTFKNWIESGQLDPNHTFGLNEYRRSIIFEVCNESKKEWLKLILKHGANPNVKNGYGNYPLTTEIRSSRNIIDVETAKILIEAGADINCKGEQGDTLAHIAVDHIDCKVIEFLIAKEADFQIENDNGKTPFDIAIDFCRNNKNPDPSIKKMLKLLVDHSVKTLGEKDTCTRKLSNIYEKIHPMEYVKPMIVDK